MPFADAQSTVETCVEDCVQIGPSAAEAEGTAAVPAAAPKTTLQLEAPAEGANELKAQAAQPAAELVPGLVTVPAKPGAHKVQAATEPAAALASVEMPCGQAVQLDELAGAKLPAGHARQPVALDVPTFLTTPVNPGAQTLQAATEVLPVADAAV